MLTAIKNALAAADKKARREDARDAVLMHFVNETSAVRFLEEHSIVGGGGDLFSGSLAPLHKWLQAIYLTDGGDIPIGPDHLGKVLDVPFGTALAMLQTLASFRPN